jgi:hypothetical protein
MKLVSLLLTALLPSLAVAYTCPHGKDQHRALSPEDALPWTENESLRNSVQARPGVKPNKHQVNLDLAPEERWVEIGKIYANRSTEIIDYFEDVSVA